MGNYTAVLKDEVITLIPPSGVVFEKPTDNVEVPIPHDFKIDDIDVATVKDILSMTHVTNYDKSPFVKGTLSITYTLWPHYTDAFLYKEDHLAVNAPGKKGFYEAVVTSPAKNPDGKPDPTPKYVGEFTIESHKIDKALLTF